MVQEIFQGGDKVKRVITIILLSGAILSMILYLTCSSGCSALKGTLLGVLPLEYTGIVFASSGIVLAILNHWSLPVLLSLAAGGEIFLTGFQIYHRTYCPFCLLFCSCVVTAFILNFKKDRLIPLGITAGFLAIFFTFRGGVVPAYGAETILPVFGNGEREIRVYTDYFCPPCQAMEGEITAYLIRTGGNARVVFVDFPIHGKASMVYIERFISLLPGVRTLADALLLRTTLFEAAKKGIRDPAELDRFLAGKGYTPYNSEKEQIYSFWRKLILEDRVDATPTVVLREGLKFRKATGGDEIRKLFREIITPG
jgi:thiol:disulfide interchange protein DsbA